MAATHPRRKKSELALESTSCDPTNFLESVVNSQLPIRELVLKILQRSGPFSQSELLKECKKAGKLTVSRSGVNSALAGLIRLGLVVRVNGGYAIHNWERVGA